MSISLTQPLINSVDWGTAVNTNFSLIEGALNNGGCKAWINFNGNGTVSIRSSFNVSSLTDNGTGQYTINLINAMANTDFLPIGTARQRSDGTRLSVGLADVDPSSTSAVAIRIFRTTDGTTSGDLTDSPGVNIAVFGAQ